MLRTFIFLSLFSLSVNGQQYLQDARSIATSTSFVAANHPIGTPENLATLINQKKSFIESTGINKYSISELNAFSLAYAKKLNDNNSLLLAFSNMGNNAFKEQFIELGISKRIMQKFSIGVKLKYNQWKPGDDKYQTRYALLPELSLMVTALPKLNLGVIIRNPVRSRMYALEEKLPAAINTGASVRVSEKVTFCLASVTATGTPASVNAGLEYCYASQFTLRAGYQSYPPAQSFGCEFSLSKFDTSH